ncbi:MAG: alanine racemase [Bacteroidetes bacterium]|nr:alanine racemase [Bacteroidota bacterium]MCY4206186.1 alanine racemase [Bacteroidota bacterium]
MCLLEDLPTPCLLVDERRMEANLAKMSARITTADLRPHTKTHKSVALARRQLAHRASGITVAKISEAEIFVQHGFDDVRIAYTLVGEKQLERVIELSKKARISFCIDTLEGAHRASRIFKKAGINVDVLLEIDTGHGRCGVPYDHENLVDIALNIQNLEGLHMCGILTHEGNAYAHHHLDRTEVMAQTRDRMLETAIRLKRAHCIDPATFEISLGSTPSISVFENRNEDGIQITEVRPGNYIFNDLTQVALGVSSLNDCALTILSTVVSKQRTSRGTERFILDAGRKIFSSDTIDGQPGYGCILYNPRVRSPHPHATINGLSEEHGWGEVQGGSTLNIGDRVQIVPNHACVAVNMMDQMFLVDEKSMCSRITVDARGCVI